MKNASVYFLLLSYYIFDCDGKPSTADIDTLTRSTEKLGLTIVTPAYDMKPEFEIETVDGIENRDTNTTLRNHLLQDIDYNKQRKLCEDAKMHALNKGMPVKFVYNEMSVKPFTIVYKVSVPETQPKTESGMALVKYDCTPEMESRCFGCVGLKCPTVPMLILCLTARDSLDKMKLVVTKNPFLDDKYNFLEEVVESVQYLAALDYYYNAETKEGDYIFSEHGMKARWEVCIAAKERINNKVIIYPVDYWPEVVGMYNIVYSDERTHPKVVAFMCNSSPKMYIRRSSVLKNVFHEIFLVTMEASEIRLGVDEEGVSGTKSETTRSDLFFSAMGSPRMIGDSSSQKYLDYGSSSSLNAEFYPPAEIENIPPPAYYNLAGFPPLMKRFETSLSARSLEVQSPRDSEITPLTSPLNSPHRPHTSKKFWE